MIKIVANMLKILADKLSRGFAVVGIPAVVGLPAVVFAIAGAGIAGGVALWNYHEQPQFCADLCHMQQPYLDSWQTSKHAEKGVTCLQCHDTPPPQMAVELIRYVTNEYATPLTEQKYLEAWCVRCHEHASYVDLIERTKDYVINGQKINPHDFKVNLEDPFAPHDSEKGELDCYRCHKMHNESPGFTYCYQCHHGGTFQKCENCHEGRKKQ